MTHSTQRPPIAPALAVADLLDRARSIGQALALEASARDQQPAPPHDAFDRIRQARLGAARVPVSLGGAGAAIDDVVRIAIELAKGDPSVAQAMLPHFVFVERTLLMATPAQVRHYLAHVGRGDIVGGASAERGGQFRGEMHTRLRRDGDAYRLDGTKHYSTGALLGDWVKVLALDEQNQTVLVVLPADRPGLVRHDDWEGMGQRCTASGTTELRQVQVQEHEVMRVQRWQSERHHTGAASQIIHCAIEIGIAHAALRDAADWVGRGVRPVRESGVQRAQDDPYILHTVGQMAARTHAAEELVLEAARRIELASQARFNPPAKPDLQLIEDLAVQASLHTAAAKIASTEAALLTAQQLFDVGGAATTLRGLNHDRHWRNARTHTVHDPLAYKFRAIGNHALNGTPPPIGYGY